MRVSSKKNLPPINLEYPSRDRDAVEMQFAIYSKRACDETLWYNLQPNCTSLTVLLVFIHEDLLAATFANDQTGVSQTELVHAPERDQNE
jgi:hypothetical protein